MNSIRFLRRHKFWLVALLVVLSGCGGDEPASGRVGSRSIATGRVADVEPFCGAVKALDATDGATEQDVVLKALREMVRTAPEQVRDDIQVLVDNLIIDNYPSAATDSMKRSSVQAGAAAGQRVGAFVEQHCGVGADD